MSDDTIFMGNELIEIYPLWVNGALIPITTAFSGSQILWPLVNKPPALITRKKIPS
jgi:hypothetical protein